MAFPFERKETDGDHETEEQASVITMIRSRKTSLRLECLKLAVKNGQEGRGEVG